MELLTLHPGGRHGDVEPSGIDLPSGSVPGAASESSRTRIQGGGSVGMCFWKIIIAPLILSQKAIYRRRGRPRRRPGGRGGSHPRPHLRPRPGVAPGPWLAPPAPLRQRAGISFRISPNQVSRRRWLRVEFVQNNHRPTKIRANRYLWASSGAEATSRGQGRVPPSAPPQVAARGRP